MQRAYCYGMYREATPVAEHHDFELPPYNLSQEQYEALAPETAVAYHLATDDELKQYTTDTKRVKARVKELTGFDDETVVKVNRFLSKENEHRSKYARIGTSDTGARFELTNAGIRYLESQIEEVGGIVVISQAETTSSY